MANPRIGVVGIPGRWSTEALADAVEAATGFRLVVDMDLVQADLQNGRLLFKEWDLCQLDAVIVKKISAEYSPNSLDRLELLRLLEGRGVRVFSRVDSMLRLIDRLSCTMTLGNAGIPMPATRVTESVAAAAAALRDFGSAVFKPLYSTKARGMAVIEAHDPPDEMERQIESFQAANPMMYIQQRLHLPGRDLGMVFLGGDYLGSYARVSHSGAWNTTIHSGGHYENFQADDSMIELAHRAQALFNLDFTTVDVAESEQGPVVFEVSAFGGFRGALEGIGIDAAAGYVAHALKELAR